MFFSSNALSVFYLRSIACSVFLELFTEVLFRSSFSFIDCNLSYVTSVREVVIARAHVTVCPGLRDAEAWRVARGRGVVQLSLQCFVTSVTALVKVKI